MRLWVTGVLFSLLGAACLATPGTPAGSTPIDSYDPENYRQAIDEQSALHGPYDPSLGELFYGLGQALQQQGNHPEAVEAFLHSMQINRINDGIYSFSQEPVLRGIIDSLELSGEHQKQNFYYQQLVKLYKPELARGPSDIVPILLESSRWHLKAFQKLRYSFNQRYLQSSIKLAGYAKEITARHYGDSHPKLIASLLQLTESSYYLAHSYSSGSYFLGSEAQSLNKYLIDKNYQQGLSAYQQVIDIHQQAGANPRQLAAAQISLGDYLQLFQQHNAASEAYASAWHTLNKAGDQDSLKRLLGKPVMLPNFESDSTGLPKSLARIKVDLDQHGKAHNIKVLETYPPDSRRVAERARKVTHRSIFRSPVSNGSVTSRKDFEFNLPLN